MIEGLKMWDDTVEHPTRTNSHNWMVYKDEGYILFNYVAVARPKSRPVEDNLLWWLICVPLAIKKFVWEKLIQTVHNGIETKMLTKN